MFANYDIPIKRIFEYEDIKSEPHEIKVKNINPYLVDTKDIFITKRSNPICSVPKMFFGNQPNDNGGFLLSDGEKIDFLKIEPMAEKYIKPFISAYEFLNGYKRWCFWLKGANPSELKTLPNLMQRIEIVREHRLASSRSATIELAQTPTLFGFISQPNSNYILIPRHSSENREYIPFGFFDKNSIVADSCYCTPDATLFHFGILMSKMHNVWIKNICGRIKSDYRYSNTIVYNNYPWPKNPTEKQIKAIEEAAQKVLDTRLEFPNSSLADLYDPLTMPPALVKAHNELDKAVDLAYRPQPFTSETNRMGYLFELYEKYTADLFTKEKTKKRKR